MASDPAHVSFSDPPTCRAAIRHGVLTLNRWRPGLVGAGPEPAALHTVTAAVADLRVLPGGELIVTPVPRVAWTETAEDVLLRWAPTAGHRRVWLPGRVAELDACLAPVATAAVACPTCGAQWEDGDVSFWEHVRAAGWFPGTCLVCGGSLPEWSVGRSDAVCGQASEIANGERPA